MSREMISTRRTLLKAGALLAPAVAVPAAAAMTSDTARGDEETAIRQLHQDWLRRINRGDAEIAGSETIHSIAPDHSAEPERIAIAGNGRIATGRFHCAVELGAELPRDCTLGQMAHAQGTGYVRRTERRVLEVAYAKGKEGWTIVGLDFGQA